MLNAFTLQLSDVEVAAEFALVGVQLLIAAQANPVFAGNAGVLLVVLKVDDSIEIVDFVLYELDPLLEVIAIDVAVESMFQLQPLLLQLIQPIFVLIFLHRNALDLLNRLAHIQPVLFEFLHHLPPKITVLFAEVLGVEGVFVVYVHGSNGCLFQGRFFVCVSCESGVVFQVFVDHVFQLVDFVLKILDLNGALDVGLVQLISDFPDVVNDLLQALIYLAYASIILCYFLIVFVDLVPRLLEDVRNMLLLQLYLPMQLLAALLQRTLQLAVLLGMRSCGVCEEGLQLGQFISILFGLFLQPSDS